MVNESERKLLRILLDVLAETEARSETLRGAFSSGCEDIAIIDVTLPFNRVAEYFGIPYLTAVYCRDTLLDEYNAFLNGDISTDTLIDRIAEHIEWLNGQEAEIGGKVRREIDIVEYNAIMRSELL